MIVETSSRFSRKRSEIRRDAFGEAEPRAGLAPPHSARASPRIAVIGTASAQKHDYLRGLGAIPTTYGPGLAERVRGLAPRRRGRCPRSCRLREYPGAYWIVGDPSRVFQSRISRRRGMARGSSRASRNTRNAALAEAGRFVLPGLFRCGERPFLSLKPQRRRRSALPGARHRQAHHLRRSLDLHA